MNEGLQRAIEVIQAELKKGEAYSYIYIEAQHAGMLRAIELIEQEKSEE